MSASFVPRGWCSATVRSRYRFCARYQRSKAVATVFLRMQDCHQILISNARNRKVFVIVSLLLVAAKPVAIVPAPGTGTIIPVVWVLYREARGRIDSRRVGESGGHVQDQLWTQQGCYWLEQGRWSGLAHEVDSCD